MGSHGTQARIPGLPVRRKLPEDLARFSADSEDGRTLSRWCHWPSGGEAGRPPGSTWPRARTDPSRCSPMGGSRPGGWSMTAQAPVDPLDSESRSG